MGTKRTPLQKEWQRLVNKFYRSALHRKKLIPGHCYICKKNNEIHGHHYSYYPEDILKVIWLCSRHHWEWHRQFKADMPSHSLIKKYLRKFNSWDKKQLDSLELHRIGWKLKKTNPRKYYAIFEPYSLSKEDKVFKNKLERLEKYWGDFKF